MTRVRGRALPVSAVLFAMMSIGATLSAGASVPGMSFTETSCQGDTDSIARLYVAGLGREPEEGGFEWWVDEYVSGRWTFPRMAQHFVESAEFQASYGSLDNLGFVRQLYRNVLGREGDVDGIDFWLSQMASGVTRATVLMRFAESPENIARTNTVQPSLGPFNEGRPPGPFTCEDTTGGEVVAPTTTTSTTAPTTTAPSTTTTSTTAPTTTTTPVSTTTSSTTAPTTTSTTVPPAPADVVAYDTAWELPTHADPSEIGPYFDHLVARGFDGVMLSLLNHTAGRTYGRNGEGDYQVQFVDDELIVTDEHFDYMNRILDQAEAHDLKVVFVPVWGQAYINSSWWEDQCNDGMLTVDNARTLGNQIGNGIGNHPAIELWVMGGDNLCWNIGEPEDVNIWREVVGGLEDAGITGQMTYHPTAGDAYGRYPRVSAFADEPWVDVVFPQTGHCYGGSVIADTIERMKADFGKPVFLAESRYYETGSDDWCSVYSSTDRVDAADIAEDVNAAIASGVVALAYGDWNRFNWCWPSTSGRLPHDDPCGAQGIAITYNTLGEDAFLRELGRL